MASIRRPAWLAAVVVIAALLVGLLAIDAEVDPFTTVDLDDRFPAYGQDDEMDGRFPLPGWLPEGATVIAEVVPPDDEAPYVASVAFARRRPGGFDGSLIATVTEDTEMPLPSGEPILVDGDTWIRTGDGVSMSLWRMAGAGPARIRAVAGDAADARDLAGAIVLGTDEVLQIGFAYVPEGLEIIGHAAAPPKRPIPTLTIESIDGRVTVTTRPEQAGTLAAEGGEARVRSIRGEEGYLFPRDAGQGLVWREPLVGSVTIAGDLPPAMLERIAEGLTFGSRAEFEALTRE